MLDPCAANSSHVGSGTSTSSVAEASMAAPSSSGPEST